MSNEFENMAMKRILGVEKKNRVRKDVMIEEEFLVAIKERHMALSDTINVLIEKELAKKPY